MPGRPSKSPAGSKGSTKRPSLNEFDVCAHVLCYAWQALKGPRRQQGSTAWPLPPTFALTCCDVPSRLPGLQRALQAARRPSPVSPWVHGLCAPWAGDTQPFTTHLQARQCGWLARQHPGVDAHTQSEQAECSPELGGWHCNVVWHALQLPKLHCLGSVLAQGTNMPFHRSLPCALALTQTSRVSTGVCSRFTQ